MKLSEATKYVENLEKGFVANFTNDLFRTYSNLVEAYDKNPVLENAQDGRDLRAYDSLWIDPKFASVADKRIRAVIGSPYVIECNVMESHEDNKDIKYRAECVSKFVETWLEENNGVELFRTLLMGIFDGISVVEFQIIDNIYSWRQLDKERIVFNVCKDTGLAKLAFRTLSKPQEGVLQPSNKYIMLRVDDGNGLRPYGRGVNISLYWNVYFKNIAMRYWIEYCGRSGITQLWGNASADGDYESLKSSLHNFKNKENIVTKSSNGQIDIKTIGNSPAGQQAIHENLIKYLDTNTIIRTLGETLTTEIGEVGSYAASATQNTVREEVRNFDARILQNCLNKQLLMPMVKRFFGNNYLIGLEMPTIKFVNSESNSTIEQMSDVKEVVDSTEGETSNSEDVKQ